MEQQETTKTEEQVEKPSSVSGAVESFYEEQAKAKKAESSEENEEAQGSDKETPSEKEAKTGKAEEESGAEETGAKEPKFFIVDAEGKLRVPAVFKSGEKDYFPDKPEDVITWSQLGIRGNERLEELNQRETQLRQAAGMLQEIIEAKEQGRLIIKPSGSPSETPTGESEQAEESEEEDEELEFADPEVKGLHKEMKGLKKMVSDLVEENKKLKSERLAEKVSAGEAALNKAVEEQVEKYPFVKDAEGKIRSFVYDLLAKVEGGRPKYDVAEACRLTHEAVKADLEILKEKDPGQGKLTQEQKEEAIKEYLAKKGKEESAPVTKPGDGSAGSPPKEPETYDSPREAAAAAFEKIRASRKAGGKS